MTAVRAAVAAAVIAAAGVVLPVTVAPVASAETVTPLPSSTYRGLVVDQARQHLFFSGGQGSEVIAVTTDYGTKLTGIPGQFGAAGMTLSPDGSTLYVALSDGDAISAISTRTLQQTAVYPTGAGTSPQDVVVAGGRLWFSYRGNVLSATSPLTGGIGSLDPAAGGDGPPPVALEPPTAWGAPLIAVDPADAGTVVTASGEGSNHTTLAVYDVSSGAAVRTAYSPEAIASSPWDMTVTPDGKDMAVVSSVPKEVQLFALSDLAADGSYSTGDDFAMAVAIAPDGAVAAGSDYTPASGLRIFGPGGQTPRASFSAPVTQAGLVWAPDESKLYAVSGGLNPTLRIYFNPEQAPTTMTVTGPPTGVPALPYGLTGRLTGIDAFPAGATVHVRRTDAAYPSGHKLPDAPVGADGAFSVADTVLSTGNVSYALTYDGDKLHAPATSTVSAVFAVAGVTPSLRAPATAPRAAALAIPGRLSSDVPFVTGQSVHVSRTDAQGTTALPDAPLAPDGSFTVADTPPVGGTVTYAVGYAGDVSHAAAGASAAVQVSRATPALTVTADAANYAYNATATVTVHLGTTYNNKTVALYATPYGGAKTLVATKAVDTHGNLTVAYHVTRRTVFTAAFTGDYRYAPVTASRTVWSYARVTDTLKGYYTTVYVGTTPYRVYHRTANPQAVATVAPVKSGACVVFTVQKWSAGAWHTVITTGCGRTSSASVAAWTYGGTHSTSGGYRYRALYEQSPQDLSNLNTYGPWVTFLFRN